MQYKCDRCKMIHEFDPASNIRGIENLCWECRTPEEHQIWRKRHLDARIERKEIPNRWKIIHGIHVFRTSRLVWDLFWNRTDDLSFEKFIGSLTELKARCKTIKDEQNAKS